MEARHRSGFSRQRQQQNQMQNLQRRRKTVLDSAATWKANLRLRNPSETIRLNYFQTAARNRFNINQLETTDFHKFQNRLESGSGPGGRRFKSSLPDHYFQAYRSHFWFFVYSAV